MLIQEKVAMFDRLSKEERARKAVSAERQRVAFEEKQKFKEEKLKLLIEERRKKKENLAYERMEFLKKVEDDKVFDVTAHMSNQEENGAPETVSEKGANELSVSSSEGNIEQLSPK